MTPPTGRLSSRVRLGYGMGSVATGAFGTVPGLMLLPYLTDTLGIAAGLAGVIVFAPKAWDVVLNPIAGRISDRSTSPSGPRRPFLLKAGLVLAVCFALLFAGPDLGEGLDAVWVIVWFLAGATAYAFFQVPYVAMPAEMTQDYAERTRLMTWRVVLLALTILIAGGSAPAIRDAVGGRAGYRAMGVAIALIIVIGVLGAWRGTRTAPIGAVASSAGSLRDQLRIVAAAKDFRLLLTTFVLQALATGSMLAGVDYMARYVLGGSGASTLLFVCFVGPALLLTPVWSRLGLRIGKKSGYVAASLCLAAGALILLASRQLPMVGIYLATALVGIGYSGAQLFPLAMLPDTAAVDAARSGSNRVGVFTGIWTAGETLGLAVGPGLYGLALALGHYVSSSDNGMTHQPDSAITAIVIGFSVVPALLTLVSLWWLRQYSLTASAVDNDPGGSMNNPSSSTGPDVLARLAELQRADLPVHGGRTLAYVYDSGLAVVDEVGRTAVAAYAGSNGLDPTAFPSLLQMENELVGFTAELLDAPDGVVGTVTSGGTESILLAVQTARDAHPEIERPTMVLPTTAHAAFHKAGHYFGVEPVLVEVDPVTCRADAAAMSAAIDDRTVLVVASAPSYAHGVVDPIAPVAAAAASRGVRCHVDACIGGWILPYAVRLGRDVPPWTFDVEGVTSISVDLHKYAYAPKGTSILLHRDSELRRPQFFASAAWPGYTMLNSTMQSTKSGGPLAAAWAVVNTVGDNGYLALTTLALDAVDRIAEMIEAARALRLVAHPDSTLLCVATDASCDVFTLADEMAGRGWFVQPQMHFGAHPASLHLSVSAATAAHLDELDTALGESVAAAVAAGPVEIPGELGAAVQEIDAETLDEAGFAGLLRLAGLDGDAGLPTRMAPINALLDIAPAALREALLKAFLDRLSRPVRGT